MKKGKYWNPEKINKYNATYNIIFGQRSNGKTYGALKYGLEIYKESGGQIAYIRRWDDDIKGYKGDQLFNGMLNNGVFLDMFNAIDVKYKSRAWYMVTENGIEEEPFAYAFSISGMEHVKSLSYPKISTIIFDEFISRDTLRNEFVMFMNLISTIARDHHKVKIYMLGNSVNMYSPYFDEMGLYRISKMQEGDIDIYTYKDSRLTVAVQYADNLKENENAYLFAFNNPKLKMITHGEWEIGLYNHLPAEYDRSDIIFIFFILHRNLLMQCELIYKESLFIFIHRKTTPLKENENDLIYTKEPCIKPNYRADFKHPKTKIEKIIQEVISEGNIYFQDNTIGDIFYNYIKEGVTK